ncbi:hypothetical protein VTN31DRAFT_2588 [Thermomyces dupontii]|uniref:uncharacterized protein n=1 Tax=Talaromyces thermophilus TaxID=28565 RepID=UPI0037420413
MSDSDIKTLTGIPGKTPTVKPTCNLRDILAGGRRQGNPPVNYSYGRLLNLGMRLTNAS